MINYIFSVILFMTGLGINLVSHTAPTRILTKEALCIGTSLAFISGVIIGGIIFN